MFVTGSSLSVSPCRSSTSPVRVRCQETKRGIQEATQGLLGPSHRPKNRRITGRKQNPSSVLAPSRICSLLCWGLRTSLTSKLTGQAWSNQDIICSPVCFCLPATGGPSVGRRWAVTVWGTCFFFYVCWGRVQTTYLNEACEMNMKVYTVYIQICLLC